MLSHSIITGAFKVLIDPNTNIISLEVVGGKHLAIIKEYYLECVSIIIWCIISTFRMFHVQGNGSDDCDLVDTNIIDDGKHTYCMFKSATQPGGHIRVLPTGLITSTTEITPCTDGSLFRVRYIVSF